MTRTLPFLAAALLLGLAGCAAPAARPEAPRAEAPAPTYGLQAIRAVGKHKGDYLPAHNFKLEIDGVISGGFKSITGLESEIEVIELTAGFLADPELVAWLREGEKAERKSGSVIYLDREGQEVVRVAFTGARPRFAATKDVGFDVTLVEKLALTVEATRVKTRHDTVKNSVGNIR